MKKIYYLESRGQMFIYHFYVYLLGGLYYIFNEIKHEGPKDTSIKFFDRNKVIKEKINLEYPIDINFGSPEHEVKDFQMNALELLKDKLNFINLEDINEDYSIIEEYGETVVNNPYSDNPEKIFPFLRNLFLSSPYLSLKEDLKRRIYITRRGSEKQHKGVGKRLILNEVKFFSMLKNHNFEYIQLEKYSEKEKIEMFYHSEIIISAHSSGLTYCLFANEKTKIIEILNKGEFRGPANGHYQNICNYLKLNYFRYSNIKENQFGNFNIRINQFENYLKKLI